MAVSRIDTKLPELLMSANVEKLQLKLCEWMSVDCWFFFLDYRKVYHFLNYQPVGTGLSLPVGMYEQDIELFSSLFYLSVQWNSTAVQINMLWFTGVMLPPLSLSPNPNWYTFLEREYVFSDFCKDSKMSLSVLRMKLCSIMVVLGQNTYRKRHQKKREREKRKQSPACIM